MSDSISNQGTRQNALAQIGFNSLTEYSDSNNGSDDDSKDVRDSSQENAQAVISISIGHAQTRLTSPQTPAAEKAAALEDVEGGSIPNHVTSQNSDDKQNQLQHEDVLEDEQTAGDETRSLPSPWRAGPRKFQRLDETRSSLRYSVNGRPRASSVGLSTESLRKLLPFNIPSIPKSPSWLNFQFPTISVLSDNSRTIETINPYETVSRKAFLDGSNENPKVIQIDQGGLNRPTKKTSETRSISISQRSSLRRSVSEDSLLLKRTLSTASSLGDDARFENVSGQVNSRLKAIKDSWQDTNFKFPSISNLSFGNPRQDPKQSQDFTEPGGGPSVAHTTETSLTNSSSTQIPKQNSDSTQKSSFQTPLNGKTSISQNDVPQTVFSSAVRRLKGDAVILGGYRGSILRAAEPPHRQLWVPLKVGLNLRKVDLEVGLSVEDEENMRERIIPGGMLKNIGPVDIAKRLFKRLRASDNAQNGTLRVHDYGYDWRLSPHILCRQLIEFLEKLPCNTLNIDPAERGATVIAHSLGGLITRHAVNLRPELFSGIIYAGVPTSCVNILGPLRNGDDVLLSSRVLTAQVNFSIRTSFALLPLEGNCFFNKHTKEEYILDFFDTKTWVDYCLSPCVAAPIPVFESTASISLNGIINTMSNVLPSLQVTGKRTSMSRGSVSKDRKGVQAAGEVAESAKNSAERTLAAAEVSPQMDKNSGSDFLRSRSTSVSTAVTISRDAAMEYLTRTLAETKAFKEALAYNQVIGSENRYPPAAVIYGKSTPTVYGAKVESREAIKRSNAYEELAFASGDGVVLARAAMLPNGYQAARGGVVSTDRGHVCLLGDLEAVGRCLRALAVARQKGVGLGETNDAHKSLTTEGIGEHENISEP